MEAKPIFVVGLPCKGQIELDILSSIEGKIIKKLPDYRVLIYYSGEIEEPKFQCFNAKDMTEINYQELKELIWKQIDSPTQEPKESMGSL